MSGQKIGVMRTDDGCSITRYCREHRREPEDVVQQMRREVNEDTKLTVSAGIAPNKVSFYATVMIAHAHTVRRCLPRSVPSTISPDAS